MLSSLALDVRGPRRHLAALGSPGWRPTAALSFAPAALALLVAFWCWPEPGVQLGWAIALRLLSVVAFLVGALASRPAFRSDWLVMLAGVVMWTVSDTSVGPQLHGHVPLPALALAGVLSTGGFVSMGLGIVRLARRDGFVRTTAVPLDAPVVAISVALCWWLVVGHEIGRGGPDLVTSLLVGVTAVGDVLLLVASGVLMTSRAAHALSSRVLVVASAVAIVRDLGFGLCATGAGHCPPWVQGLRMAQFAAYAMAALLAGAPPRGRQRMSSLALGLVVAALVSPGLVLGAMLTRHPGAPLPACAVWVVAGATVVMGALVGLRVLGLVRRLERQTARLETTARTDCLTSLPNRRAGAERLQQWLRASGPDLPLAVAMVDVDHFKAFNDTHGHLQGDSFLRAAAITWGQALGSRGQIFRYGGEEFLVVMPGAAEAEATALLARMRSRTPLGQSFSAGVATWRRGEDVQTLLGRADDSLYAAKAAGRACTVAAC